MSAATASQKRISLPLVVALASFALVAACESREPALLASECSETIGGVQYFVGSPRCFESLPQATMSGFWVVGHEYSVFYSALPSEIWELDPSATWLSFSEEAARVAERYLGDGEFHVVEVEFVGAASNREGHYGPGEFRSGVHVSKFTHIAEVPGAKPHRGMPPNTSFERTRGA